MSKRWLDPELKQYCTTERQREYIDAVNQYSSIREAAREIGTSHATILNALEKIEARAAAQGYAPNLHHHKKGLSGFSTDRISAYYGKDGDLRGEWHIQNRNREAIAQALKDFVDGLCEQIPKAEPVKHEARFNDPDLMSGIFIGDAHVGQYSYAPETRQGDFDTDIATKQIRDAIDYLVAVAPMAKTGLLVDVGDALHADSAHNTTFKGTPVDVDTRYHRTLRALAMVMRYSIDRMLQKFEKVVVVVARGNHNDSSAIAIQLMLEFCFENEPRVEILNTQGYFHYLQFGKWLLAVHHGDKVKTDQLPGILARDLPQAWGETTHRMWAVGHIHHQNTKELNGCFVRSFGTLAASDGWHASQGYGSQRVMEMLTFRRSGGLHSTQIYNIEREVVVPDIKL